MVIHPHRLALAAVFFLPAAEAFQPFEGLAMLQAVAAYQRVAALALVRLAFDCH
jgi:hypothetical protein